MLSQLQRITNINPYSATAAEDRNLMALFFTTEQLSLLVVYTNKIFLEMFVENHLCLKMLITRIELSQNGLI